MKIDVTEEHIALGKGGRAGECPIALACNQAGLSYAGVGYRSLSFFDKSVMVILDLPLEAKLFVNHFDRYWAGVSKDPPKPFSFELDWSGPINKD